MPTYLSCCDVISDILNNCIPVLVPLITDNREISNSNCSPSLAVDAQVHVGVNIRIRRVLCHVSSMETKKDSLFHELN